MQSFTIQGNIVDLHAQEIYPGEISVANGKIQSIAKLKEVDASAGYLMPGFIDSHVHVESSMLVPSEFAKLAVVHGTVATISDPHEIANVCGVEGVKFMIENGKTVPFKFHFGAPSCVPATIFETAGAAIDSEDVRKLLASEDIFYLSEMMNFPGVLHGDKEVLAKIDAAKNAGKPVDGHAPGLMGEDAKKYIDAGISTDHECFTMEEALGKLQHGMKILIREGSAAKNFEALIPLLNDYPDMIMFCSDDKHPDSLVEGHIDQLCARAVKKGIDIFKILKAACLNPVLHYRMKVGTLREGDLADFIQVKDLQSFKVERTYVNGTLVAEKGKSLINTTQSSVINNFNTERKSPSDFEVRWNGNATMPVIGAQDGQLITDKLDLPTKTSERLVVSDTENDILKIVVVNRYSDSPVAKSFVKNFGLKQGAIASSVAHDSHNIVAVGVDDESICKAVNLVIGHKGGVSISTQDTELVVPLPVAGLMSNEDGYKVAAQYAAIDRAAKEAGATLASPFMTLSFMALLVIPHLKLSDRGLFDGDRFSFVK